MSQDKNYYEILEIPIDASQQAIHKAYQDAKKLFNQSNPALYSIFSPEEAREYLNLIEEAYSILKNEPLRESYNSKLLGTHSNDTPASSSQTTPSRSKSLRPPNHEIKDEMEEFIKTNTIWDGQTIKTIRNYKNIPLDWISQATKISKTYLCALEEENPKALPAPVFVRGFIIQVSKILGLNEKSVTDSYMSGYKKKIGNK